MKAFTKKAQPNGDTLYDHLTSLLLQINKDKPEDALAALEQLSVKVKKSYLTAPSFKELPQSPYDSETKAKTLKAVNDTLALFRSIPTITEEDKAAVEASLRALAAAGEDEEDGGKATAAALLPAVMKGAKVANLLGHNNLLQKAGVDMGREEAFSITMSIQRLTQSNKDIQFIRFFGKVFGTGRDYYIVETKLPAPATKEKEDPITKKEPRGTGANEHVYFVTNDLTGNWEALPDVLPEQIITAKSMRRFFTGDLHSPVLGYPRFPWPEASYLRAQIARIATCTVISPKGMFSFEEPEEEDQQAELKEDAEFEPLGVEELKEAENWVHHRAHIYKQGRCKKWEPPEADGEEEEEPAGEEEEQEEEEEVAMLSGLDAEAEAPFQKWQFKANGVATHAIASVKSNQWPGAYAVAKGKNLCNIYLGWGQEFLNSVYTPPALPAVAAEYKSTFNPEEAEEDETDPMQEMMDPLPPKDLEEEGEGDEGDEGDDN